MEAKQRFKQVYLLKEKATGHISDKKYSWAMVYLCDALKQFQSVMEHIENTDEMQKIIRDIKLPCHKNLSLCYLKQGNYTQCIQQCLEALQIQPDCVKILYRLGTAHMNSGNLVQAQKHLSRAFLLDPSQKQVMKSLQRLQYLHNSKQKIQKASSMSVKSSITLGTIIKIIFFWPIIVMLFFYRKVFPQKSKTN